MKKRIYHGSKVIITKPKFGEGNPYNDYGLGFYCTEKVDLAKEWSVDKYNDGYANLYDIDMKDLKVLNLNGEEYCVLQWLAILLKNRQFSADLGMPTIAKEYIIDNFLIDYSEADIMIGYRADDSYFTFAQDFLNGTISYEQLGNALKLGGLGEQIVLKSKKAFERLTYVDYENAPNKEWYPKKELRDRNARKEYFEVLRKNRKLDGLYITTMVKEEIKLDDSRLR